MDKVYIKQLKVPTVIGVHEWERRILQTIVLDLEMACDISKAAAEDNLAHALDYDKIAKRLTYVIENSQYKLIESLAEHLAVVLKEEFKLTWFRLKLAKPGAIANALEVGIEIER